VTTEAFEGLLSDMQGFIGRHVEVEVGTREPIAGQPVVPGAETIYAAFSGVLSRARPQGDAVIFDVGDGDAAAKLFLSPATHPHGLWRERNFRKALEIMSMQPVVIWVTPLPEEI